MRYLVLVVGLLAVGCGGGQRQGADEPEGDFRVEVVEASFPRVQHVAESVELKLSVRNADQESLRNVAVTVETEPRGRDAAVAFGQMQRGKDLADAARPIWVLDEGPKGGDTAYVNTWLAGDMGPGATRELTWKLVASRPGAYTVNYRVAPGLTGRGRAAGERTSGSFRVRILNRPVPARVGDDGEIERS